MTDAPLTILLIEDDLPNLELYRLAFSMHGHRVLTAVSGSEGIEIFKTEKPDAVICDLILGDMVGTEAIERMRELGQSRFYLLSEAEPVVLSSAARRTGVLGFQKLGTPVPEVVRTVVDDAAQAVGG